MTKEKHSNGADRQTTGAPHTGKADAGAAQEKGARAGIVRGRVRDIPDLFAVVWGRWVERHGLMPDEETAVMVGLAVEPGALTGMLKKATEVNVDDSRKMRRWMAARCETNVNYWAETRALHQDFFDWARSSGEYALHERKFIQTLDGIPGLERGTHPRTRRSVFRGLRLIQAAPELFEGDAAGVWATTGRAGARPRPRLPVGPPDDPGDASDP